MASLVFTKLDDENSAQSAFGPVGAAAPIARIRSIAKMGIARSSALLPLLSQIYQRPPNRSHPGFGQNVAPGLSDDRLFRYRLRLGLSKRNPATPRCFERSCSSCYR